MTKYRYQGHKFGEASLTTYVQVGKKRAPVTVNFETPGHTAEDIVEALDALWEKVEKVEHIVRRTRGIRGGGQ